MAGRPWGRLKAFLLGEPAAGGREPQLSLRPICNDWVLFRSSAWRQRGVVREGWRIRSEGATENAKVLVIDLGCHTAASQESRAARVPVGRMFD